MFWNVDSVITSFYFTRENCTFREALSTIRLLINGLWKINLLTSFSTQSQPDKYVKEFRLCLFVLVLIKSYYDRFFKHVLLMSFDCCHCPSTDHPPASQVSREVANLTERKNPQTSGYGVKEFVCLFIITAKLLLMLPVILHSLHLLLHFTWCELITY